MLTLLDNPSTTGLDEYVVRVKATDQGGLSITRDFTFDVIPSPGNLFISNDTIRESALDQTFVAIILTDSVRTGDTVDYSLVAGVGSEDNHLFVINKFS